MHKSFATLAIACSLAALTPLSCCQAAATIQEDQEPVICKSQPKMEITIDYLTHTAFKNREIDTVSIHFLENITKKNNRSVYRGITVTRPYGYLEDDDDHTTHASSAIGVGPIYMIRNERFHSGKLTGAIDMSGGLIIYDRAFPAGGRAYNFMWRIGPQFIYRLSNDASINLGYIFMHVSNGFRTHNPGYNGRGITLSYTAYF